MPRAANCPRVEGHHAEIGLSRPAAVILIDHYTDYILNSPSRSSAVDAIRLKSLKPTNFPEAERVNKRILIITGDAMDTD